MVVHGCALLCLGYAWVARVYACLCVFVYGCARLLVVARGFCMVTHFYAWVVRVYAWVMHGYAWAMHGLCTVARGYACLRALPHSHAC
eukprot:5209355-Lingulodinium_polyedra.AAC.1